MAPWKVPLADLRAEQEDIDAVVDVYRSGWLSMGPRTEELERAFAEYTGAHHAIAVSNGTAALHLALVAAGIGPGDEVIVPSLTFVASVNAIVYAGARPVFADIAGLERPWLSRAAVEEAIGERTRGVLAVHYGGHPGEIDELAELAGARGLALLEDAAHAAGSRHDGRHLGTAGLAGAFSFFSNKNLAAGEGGMLVTDDDGVGEHARLLRSHGMTTLTWDRHRGHAAGYDVVAVGFNYRIDEPRAAFLLPRLARLDAENNLRRRLDQRYRHLLERVPGVTPTEPPPGDESSHHLFTVVLDEGVDREALREELAAGGVQTSLHYPPAHRFSVHSEGAPELPLTDAYAARSVTLPLFSHMTEAQQDLVVSMVERFLRVPA